MKNNKKGISFLAVYAIVLVLYNVIFFVIPFPKNASAFIEYGASLLAIVLGAVITYIAFSKGDTVKSKVYGFPIFRLGMYYSAVQLVFGLAVCITGFWVEVPIYVSVTVSVLILGLSLIGVIGADNVRDVIERQEVSDAAAIQNISALISDMKGISEQSTDPALKARLQKLYEQFRYSDPVSSSATLELEAKLREEIAALKGSVSSDDSAAAKKAEEIERLLEERNRICKSSK